MTPAQWAYRVVQARNTLRHGQRPTDAHVRIAWALARWQHASPSHAKLARAARVHRNTARNALERLRALGLLDWERQFTRLRGGRFAQVANRYSFLSPASLPAPRAATGKKSPIFPCSTKFVQRSVAQQMAALGDAGGSDLLAARNTALKEGWVQFGRKFWERKPA